MIVDCGDRQKMYALSLHMGGKWVEIATQDYLIPIYTEVNSVQRSTGMCKLCIKQSEDLYWHVGTSLLRGYYAEFIMSDRKLVLTPLASDKKLSLIEESAPSRYLGANFF